VSDVMMPLNLRHARTSVRYLDSSGISRGMFGGQTIVAARGGDRLALTLEMTKHGGRTTTGLAERAQLRAWLASLRGRQNPVFAQDKSRQRRGSFPTGELLANNTFENGTTGWAASGEYALTASDRLLRATRTAVSSNQYAVRPSANVTVVQYAPYVMRYFVLQGRGAFASGFTVDETVDAVVGAVNSTFGMMTAVTVPATTAARPSLNDRVSSTFIAGDYIQVAYASMARCALVDNAVNLLLRSDEFDNASWTKTRCDVPNSQTAPDGTATADTIREDSTASNTHLVVQSVAVASGAADYCFTVALKPSGRNWAVLEMHEGTNGANCYFNVSTGAVGTPTTGANWANLRTAVTDLGNGFYQCSITARKTSSSTSIACRIYLATADTTSSYSGNGTSAVIAWRATIAASSGPRRLTSTAANNQGPASVSSMQTGSALYLRGLPASTNGLLEIDDQVEIITGRGSELKIVTARLSSDAAGMGYLQFEPPLRTAPVDGAPVIIHQPMGRFLFSGDAVGFDNDPGVWTTASAEFEEA